MKKVKGLSVVMAALLAAQGGMNPAVFATKSKKEMKKKIQNQFLQTIFFHQDRIVELKQFLPNNMKKEDIPKSFRTPEFLELLKKNEVMVSDISKNVEKEKNSKQQTINLREIIEEDNLELLRKEAGKENFINTRIKGSLFEENNMEIPILQYCGMKKAIKCFKFLLLNGANPSEVLGGNSKYKDWDCMSIAICFGEWEMMKILEERGIKKETNLNVWEAAALTHRNNILKLFISKKDEIPNFDEYLQAGMRGVVRGNNLKGLKLLLKEGLDVNAKDTLGRTPLHYAAENDAVEVAKILISKGANIKATDSNGRTPLHETVMGGAAQVAELLISEGADVNAKDNSGWTSLDVAASNKNLRMARLLINSGQKINLKGRSGDCLLSCAVDRGDLKMTELLASKGANINMKNAFGTLLHSVIESRKYDLAKILISGGADVNARDDFERTPLHTAAENDAVQVADILISKGADINAEDENGYTPLHIAEENRAVKVVELLKSKGAKED